MTPDEMIPQTIMGFDEEVDLMEKNLPFCPFCNKAPFYEDTVGGWYVSCHCGARVPGSDVYEATAKWSKRPALPAEQRCLREGPRAAWTAW
ncbi:MAG: hypothetical protein JNK54_06470 [Elusimicrobia bacterium]|nr:hypothetical protein [Elusimicrobiota bacterium]